jgi:hypothetical protein
MKAYRAFGVEVKDARILNFGCILKWMVRLRFLLPLSSGGIPGRWYITGHKAKCVIETFTSLINAFNGKYF